MLTNYDWYLVGFYTGSGIFNPNPEVPPTTEAKMAFNLGLISATGKAQGNPYMYSKTELSREMNLLLS